MRWVVRRLATAGLYALAITGITMWADNPDSCFLIVLRFGSTTLFLGWAVWRTIGHWHEDRGDA